MSSSVKARAPQAVTGLSDDEALLPPKLPVTKKRQAAAPALSAKRCKTTSAAAKRVPEPAPELEPEVSPIEVGDDVQGMPAVVPREKDDMPERPRRIAKRRPASAGLKDGQDRFKLMMYHTHGESGTVAIRDKCTGKQIVEMSWKGVTLAASRAAAEKVLAELHNGIDVADAKELAQQFKTVSAVCPTLPLDVVSQ